MQVAWSESEIQQRIAELGREIREEAEDHEILLVGVLKTAAVFLSDLMRAIDGPVRYEFLDKIADISDTEIAEAVEIDYLSHFDMRGQRVYLLKDVVTTGVIEEWLLTQLRMRQPELLRLVALIDCPDRRTTPLEVDFRAFQGGKGRYVGYGLDHEGKHANARAISIL